MACASLRSPTIRTLVDERSNLDISAPIAEFTGSAR
jgi:hypothetical protein